MGNQLNLLTFRASQTKSMHRIKVDNYVSIDASDTVGIGTSNPSKDGWVPKFALLISAEQTINLGRSGTTIREAIHQQLPKVFNYKPNVITICYTSNLNEMLSQLRNKLGNDTRILVGNIPDLSQVNIYTSLGIPKLLPTLQIKRWNDAIKQIVKKNQCDLVDLYSHWKELSEHPEYISFYGFYLSTHGYERLAQIFYQQYLK